MLIFFNPFNPLSNRCKKSTIISNNMPSTVSNDLLADSFHQNVHNFRDQFLINTREGSMVKQDKYTIGPGQIYLSSKKNIFGQKWFLNKKDVTSKVEVDLLSNTTARRWKVLASIAVQDIKGIHCIALLK